MVSILAFAVDISECYSFWRVILLHSVHMSQLLFVDLGDYVFVPVHLIQLIVETCSPAIGITNRPKSYPPDLPFKDLLRMLL